MRTILYILSIVGYWILATEPNPINSQSDKINPSGNKHVQYKVIICNIVLVTVIEILHSIYYDLCPVSYFEYLLFIIMMSGLALSLKGYSDLGTFYSFNIGIKDSHKLIQNGIYKYIRNPGYTGQFIYMSSFLLLFNVFYVINFFLFVYILFLMYYRVKNEEKMLSQYFGEEYQKYCQETKRFIPKIF